MFPFFSLPLLVCSEANSKKIQAAEIAEAERLEKEALMRRGRAVDHGTSPRIPSKYIFSSEPNHQQVLILPIRRLVVPVDHEPIIKWVLKQ